MAEPKAYYRNWVTALDPTFDPDVEIEPRLALCRWALGHALTGEARPMETCNMYTAIACLLNVEYGTWDEDAAAFLRQTNMAGMTEGQFEDAAGAYLRSRGKGKVAKE